MFYISFENSHYEWNGLQEIFSCPQIIENSTDSRHSSSNRYFTENRRWVPQLCVNTILTALLLSCFLYA